MVCRVRRRRIEPLRQRSHRGGVGFRINNPHQLVGHGPNLLKSPLVQGGTLFSSNVAPPRRHEKLVLKISPLLSRGGDAWPTATAGWLCAVFVGDGSNHRDSGRAAPAVSLFPPSCTTHPRARQPLALPRGDWLPVSLKVHTAHQLSGRSYQNSCERPILIPTREPPEIFALLVTPFVIRSNVSSRLPVPPSNPVKGSWLPLPTARLPH